MTRAAIACVRVTYGSLRCTLRGRRSGKANDARREPVSQLRFISSNMTGVRAAFKIDFPLFTTGDVRFGSGSGSPLDKLDLPRPHQDRGERLPGGRIALTILQPRKVIRQCGCARLRSRHMLR